MTRRLTSGERRSNQSEKLKSGNQQSVEKRQQSISRLRQIVNDDPEVSINHIAGMLTDIQVAQIAKRHPDRAAAIVRLLASGHSFQKAWDDSESSYDTINWGKIPSRMARGAGSVLSAAKHLIDQRKTIFGTEVEGQVRTLGTHIQSLCIEHMAVLTGYALLNRKTSKLHGKASPRNTSNAKTRDGKIVGNLKQMQRFLQKNIHDIPLFPVKLGSDKTLPTVAHISRTAISIARAYVGTEILICLLDHSDWEPSSRHQREGDLLGVGEAYAGRFTGLSDRLGFSRVIATHKKPDADALVATWMAERFLFPNERCRVKFVSRLLQRRQMKLDCVVDIGKAHDPNKLRFDHKPPAFSHRDQSCATRLVWEHLLTLGHDVGHLELLVDLVHDGDASTRRGNSAIFRASRINGLHALIKQAHLQCAEGANNLNDQMLYRAIKMWLDAAATSDKRIRAALIEGPRVNA